MSDMKMVVCGLFKLFVSPVSAPSRSGCSLGAAGEWGFSVLYHEMLV